MNRLFFTLWVALGLPFTLYATNGLTASPPLAPPPPCAFTVLDNFSDGNFTSNPVWSGENIDWDIQSSTTIGSGTTNTNLLRLDPDNNNGGSYYLTTPITDWQSSQEWAFWMGRRFQLSGSSNVEIWLCANESNLESNTVDGYRLIIGDGSGSHEIRLQRMVNGVQAGADIIVSSSVISSSRNDFGISIRVVRSETGNWQLFSSTIPVANGSGASPTADPTTNTTVSLGTGTDNTLIPIGTNYFGFKVNMPSGLNSSNRRTTEFDNIQFKPCLPNTTVQIVSSSYSTTETAGSITIPVSITNPHPTLATTVQLVLTSGTASAINNYTTQTITFPAASVSSQNVTITITDNETCEIESAFTFALQNQAGGYAALLGTTTSTALVISDDEYYGMTLMSENFESGNANGWNATPASSFSASTNGPISGSYSLRHVDSGQTASGTASCSFAYDGAGLQGSETTWKFNLNHYNTEPNSSDYMIICLTNINDDIANEVIDGYAITIMPFGGTQDFVRLCRTENDMLYPILTTSLDWGTAQGEVGFQITRDANGVWNLKMDLDGDFNNLVDYGSVTNTFWDHTGYFGAFYAYNTSTKGKFSIDDITIEQSSCAVTYYSQSTGNSDGSIWAPQPVGTAQNITSGPFTSLVVQANHVVDVAQTLKCNDLTVNANGTLNANANQVSMLGQFLNNGTFNSGASTFRFIGNAVQSIGGTGTTTFNNIELENAAGLTTNIPISLKGQLRPIEGTFNTNNQLTLISNLQGSGSIGRIYSGADVIGQITMQRFVPQAPQHYVYLTNPILNQTIQNWNDDIITTGFPGSDYPSYNFMSLYTYNETVAGSKNMGWTGVTNVTDAMDPQAGYIVYMNANAATISMSGNFQKGNVNVPLDYTDVEPGTGSLNPDGWNLVGNVYPCAIDWQALHTASTSWVTGNSTYYVYNATESNYRAYNASSQGGTANRYIASGQAFFIQATGLNQSLQFTESAKSTSDAAFQRNTDESMLVRLNLTQGSMTDEVLFTIMDDASSAFDVAYDALKWDSPVTAAPELAILGSDSVKMCINTINAFEESISFPLFVEMPAAGDYTFSVSEVLNLPTGVCITIQDLETGITIPMLQGETITLSTTAPYAGYRLVISMNAPLHVNALDATCNGNEDGAIEINSAIEGWTVLAEDVFGNVHYATDGTISGLPSGDYNVTYENVDAMCIAASMGVTISQPELIDAEIQSTVDYCNSGMSGRIEMIVSNTDNFNYTLTNADGAVIDSGSSEDSYLMISNLPAGEFMVNLSANCFSESFEVNLNDSNTVDVEITLGTPELELELGQTVTIAANANSLQDVTYEWTVNGFDGGDQNFLEFIVNNPGTFEIMCVADNGSCSDIATSTAIVESTVGIEEELDGPQAIITRMGNALMISFQNASASRATITLYSSTGALVMKMSGNADQGQVRTIDMTSLSTGVYTIDVQQDNKVLARQQIFK
jgi:hypothetical protein